MTFDELIDFLDNRMALSHIYQPLMIRALLDAGGRATLRQLAHAFLAQDESQLQFYERRIKDMPLKVLAKHGVVSRDGDLISLTTPSLTLQQKAKVRLLCDSRLHEYVEKRGLAIWDYRMLDTDPVSDNLRFVVLKDAGQRCALCGISAKDRPIDVDHIVPRSRGGKTVRENLQALCSKCNRTKRNNDTTDFRQGGQLEIVPGCVFCSPERQEEAIAENGSVFAIRDKHPVAPGHHLIVPKRHCPDFFTMAAHERRHADELLQVLRNKILSNDASVTGFNVGVNCGEAAGQTVMHAHVHLIPRRRGDTPKPRGGVRGVIPSQMSY